MLINYKKETLVKTKDKLESFLRNYIRTNPDGFICGECKERTKDIKYHAQYGFICEQCAFIIGFFDE